MNNCSRMPFIDSRGVKKYRLYYCIELNCGQFEQYIRYLELLSLFKFSNFMTLKSYLPIFFIRAIFRLSPRSNQARRALSFLKSSSPISTFVGSPCIYSPALPVEHIYFEITEKWFSIMSLSIKLTCYHR